jgi:ABC-type glycerol-3-phosphate transport system permease component
MADAAIGTESKKRRAVRFRSRKFQDRLLLILTHGLLIAASTLFLFPFFWMISGSFKTQSELFGTATRLLPSEITLEHYQFALTAVPLLRNFLNSLFVATSYTALSLFFCSLGGFAFAKYPFPGRNALFAILIGTLMMPKMVSIVPSFVVMATLGWVNTFYALIIPGAANAFGIFFMRQYINTVPDELLDAARIDGCTDFGIYRRIVLPVIVPALTTLAIMNFIGSWNDFLWPLIILRTYKMYTLLVAINLLPAAQFNTPWAAIMAGSTISVVPLVIVFFFLQRWFISGVTLGAVRG